jgi:hypothetical protein
MWRSSTMPGLKNLCGPWDRSYGMDMQQYLAVVGLSIATQVELDAAPLPDVSQPFGHAHDFFFMPPIALLEPQVPEDARPHLSAFAGPRQIERRLEAGRRVTAWLDRDVMIGAQSANPSRAGNYQFHPATMHWRTPDGGIGGLRLLVCGPGERAGGGAGAGASRGWGGITLAFDLDAPGLQIDQVQPDMWRLPGLALQIETVGDVDFQVKAGATQLEIQVTTRHGLCLSSAGSW